MPAGTDQEEVWMLSIVIANPHQNDMVQGGTRIATLRDLVCQFESAYCAIVYIVVHRSRSEKREAC